VSVVVTVMIVCRASENFDYFEDIWAREKHTGTPEKPTSLVRAIVKAFGWYLFPSAPLLMIQNVAQLTLPFLLGPLILFMDSSEPNYVGYLYAVGFFVGLMIMTLAENAFFDRAVKTGVRIRAALVPAIYRHALRMTNQARQDRSIGAIVNHMASDTEKVQFFCQSVNNLWSAPFRLLLGLYLLIDSLGVSGVFGLLAVIILTPIQTWVIKQSALMFKDVMKKSDGRIKVLNEVLSGMRVIKYYAWELPFEKRVSALRKDELSSLSKAQTYRAINMFFMNLNPVALSVGTFVAFAAMQGNISPDQAFQALALFQQMLWPLMLFPRTISEYTEVLVALKRIEDFLLAPIVDEPRMLKDISLDDEGFPNDMADVGFVRVTDAAPEIKICDGFFSWGTESSPTLTGINVEVQKGELLAIVGQTGSGKSSLVSAMLGEMHVVSGRAKLGGKIAYIPQQAWIFNATVQENIVFGSKYDEALYKGAIRASCLQKDIDHQFEAGDQTEIGEKGINLSGGQRQRVRTLHVLQ
jgi:ABC-type multidrug transport system fused ATPase/permease subunit